MWSRMKVKWSLCNVEHFLSGLSSLVKSRDLNYSPHLFHHSGIINQIGGY